MWSRVGHTRTHTHTHAHAHTHTHTHRSGVEKARETREEKKMRRSETEEGYIGESSEREGGGVEKFARLLFFFSC